MELIPATENLIPAANKLIPAQKIVKIVLKKVKNSHEWNQIGKQKRLLDLLYVHKTILVKLFNVQASLCE